MTYAAQTSVPVGRTRQEIEQLLLRHKAQRVFSGQEPGRAVVGFEMNNRRVQFELYLPHPEDNRWRGKQRQLEQAERSRWRALLLTIKAKLVSVESGVEVFEEAFLAQIVMPGTGRTIWSLTKNPLAESYATGKMLPLLPAGG